MDKKQLRPPNLDITSFHSFRSANMIEIFPSFTTATTTSSKSASILNAIGNVDDAEQPKLPSSNQSGYAPNGGYGWVVVLASFIAHFMFGGIERSEGIYFLEFERKFGRSRSLTSIPSALVTALRLFVGPVAGALSFKYSVRITCLIGSALLFVGMLLNAFISDFDQLFLTHSTLQGIGRGFLYTPSLIIVADYFDKRRGIANGLSTSGTGIGTSLLAPLQQFLFNYYGYSGAFMVIAAISLHTSISSMLYRPVTLSEMSQASDKMAAVSRREDTLTSSSSTPPKGKSNNADSDQPTEEIKTADLDDDVTSPVPAGVKISDEITIVTYPSKDSSTIYSGESVHSSDLLITERLSMSTTIKSDNTVTFDKRRSLISYFSNATEILKKNSEKINEYYSLNLLSNPPFVLFCFSITLFTAASKSIFTFIPALITSKGYTSSEAAYVLSVTGAVDILGRISAGLLFDMIQSRLIRPVIINVVIGILAIVTFLLPVLNGYLAICMLCAINSILTGAYVSQKTVISMDVLGPSNIPNSIGIFIFFQGFGVLAGVPLSGALGELNDGYNAAFFMNGILMVASGIVMSLSNMLIRGQERASESVRNL